MGVATRHAATAIPASWCRCLPALRAPTRICATWTCATTLASASTRLRSIAAYRCRPATSLASACRRLVSVPTRRAHPARFARRWWRTRAAASTLAKPAPIRRLPTACARACRPRFADVCVTDECNAEHQCVSQWDVTLIGCQLSSSSQNQDYIAGVAAGVTAVGVCALAIAAIVAGVWLFRMHQLEETWLKEARDAAQGAIEASPAFEGKADA